MPRTALVHLLRRAYQSYRIAAAKQIPVTEVEGLLSEPFSRRQVLHGLAIAGVLGATSGDRLTQNRSRWPSDRKISSTLPADAKVLVVGAGVAGLTVAYRLQQAGVPVDVVEARPQIGGRLRSLSKSSNSPGVAELGGEFIDSRHTAVQALATELGLEIADLRAADAGLEPEILYFEGRKLSHRWVAEEFVPLAQRIAQDLIQMSQWGLTYHDFNPVVEKLDRLSLANYLDLTSIHPVLKKLVQVAYVAEYGLDAETQSCLNLLFLIGTEVGEWSAYGISDERYHIVGGNDLIPRMLAKRLEGQVETGMELESIRQTTDSGYRVSLRSGSTSTERNYEQIVLTVPFTVLRQIEMAVDMPPIKQRAIAELGYGTATKLAIPFHDRIWRTRYGSTMTIYTDKEFQNAWESARYAPGPGAWVTDLRGGSAGIALGSGSPYTHARRFIEDLEPIFPGITQVEHGTPIRTVWATEPYALGSYSCYLPGQWSTFGGAEGERVGNIWFAGEHCSIASQGYINGACETAEQVAKEILIELGMMV